MSQLDRIRARQKALEHRDELASLLKCAPLPVDQQSRMLDLLSALWLQADRACGGEETRP